MITKYIKENVNKIDDLYHYFSCVLIYLRKNSIIRAMYIVFIWMDDGALLETVQNSSRNKEQFKL